MPFGCWPITPFMHRLLIKIVLYCFLKITVQLLLCARFACFLSCRINKQILIDCCVRVFALVRVKSQKGVTVNAKANAVQHKPTSRQFSRNYFRDVNRKVVQLLLCQSNVGLEEVWA